MNTTRRQLLVRVGMLGGVGLLAAACAPSPAATTAPAAKPAATAAATTAPAAAATTAPKPAARVPAGELKVALPAKIVALDPHGAQSVEEVLHTSIQHVMETLVKRDPSNNNIVPGLATEWKTPDPMTWTFTLRNGVKYHDGSALTSADVKAVVQRVIDAKGPVAPLFAHVDSIATPNDSTVEIKTKSPVGTLLASMSLLPIAPASKVNEQGFFNKPIGTGPFKVVSWSPDADLKLEANTEYWGGAPGLKNLTFR